MTGNVAILRPKPINYWWPSFHKQTIRTIEYLRKDDDYKVLISYFLAAKNIGILQRWAFELQNAYLNKSNNYLYYFINHLHRQVPKIAKQFAGQLNSLGVIVNANSGQFLSLNHIDPTVGVDVRLIDKQYRKINKQQLQDRYIDNAVGISFDIDYRNIQGGFSRVLKLIYQDGTRLDIDYLAISDNREPSIKHSQIYLSVGLANRIWPLRLNRDTTPNLYHAKQQALSQISSNDLLGVATEGAKAFLVLSMAALPGNVPVKMPKPSFKPPLPGTGRFVRVSRQKNRAIGNTSIENNLGGTDPRLTKNTGVADSIEVLRTGAAVDYNSAKLAGGNFKLANAAAKHPDTIYHRSMHQGGIQKVAMKGELEAGSGTGMHGGGEAVRAWFGPAPRSTQVGTIEFTTTIPGRARTAGGSPYFGNWAANDGLMLAPELKNSELTITIRKIVYKDGAVARPLGNGKFLYTKKNGQAITLEGSSLPDI